MKRTGRAPGYWERRLKAATMAPEESALRDLLLQGARRGDRRAIDELWTRYRLRLELTPKVPARRA